MRPNNNLVLMVVIIAIISLTLAMVASPSIVSALPKVQIPNEEIGQNPEAIGSNNSVSSDAGSTTSFAKKGNSQTSPVPPECPKQGPIPPNCTLKPKF
jgi:hypothetical protein